MVEEVLEVQEEMHKSTLEVGPDLDYGGEPLFEGVQVVLIQWPCYLQVAL